MKVYHYTIADRLVKILIDGFLKLTPNEDGDNFVDGELRVVWFTTNDEWDDTAFYGYPKEVLDSAGRIRITVDSNTNPLGVASANSDRLGQWEALVNSASEIGVDYRDWIVSPIQVKTEDFECVELWKHDRWVEVPLRIKS